MFMPKYQTRREYSAKDDNTSVPHITDSVNLLCSFLSPINFKFLN